MINTKEANGSLGYPLAIVAAATGLTDNIRYARLCK